MKFEIVILCALILLLLTAMLLIAFFALLATVFLVNLLPKLGSLLRSYA